MARLTTAALLLFVLLLAGCATTKPLNVACTSCALLQAAALCPVEAQTTASKTLATTALPTCPKGKHPEIVNYQRWLDGEERPRIECRRVSTQ